MKKLILVLAVVLCLCPINVQSTVPDWLEPWYLGYNAQYFNHELPTEITIDHDLTDDRFMALTEFGKQYGVYRITFNRKFEPSPRQAKLTLLHEMCHIKLDMDLEKELDDHGPIWQGCMHELARKDALNDLWY